MTEFLYGISSVAIAGVLLASMLGAAEAGCRLGLRVRQARSEAWRSQIHAMQASVLGILGLLIGFTFSLALQRYDSRSEAVVQEANAIGTTYLRAQLLPEPTRDEALALLREYLGLRIQASEISLAASAPREALLSRAGAVQNALWNAARRATDADPNPVTTGLFVQALNDLIDAFSTRNAELSRHVPEVVLLLMYGTLLMTAGVVGFASGASGHRPPGVTYVTLTLIVVVVFIILDLDRPRRGLIEVSQSSLLELQATIGRPPGSLSPAQR